MNDLQEQPAPQAEAQPQPPQVEAPQAEVPEAQAPEPEPPKEYVAVVRCDGGPLPPEFVDGVRKLEQALNMDVCLFLQRDDDYEDAINQELYEDFFRSRPLKKEDRKIAVLIHSPGGDPRASYKIAKLLNACCGGYVVLVPRYAKSAATLFCLGAERIILGTHAELGPLDMQVGDPESEDTGSALNHVQALERLSAFALDSVDRFMQLMLKKTEKKVTTVLPHALSFAASTVRPLLEKVDVVKYTEMSRILKVGEEYASRLMEKKYGVTKSKAIAARLVSEYPEHGFVIDHTEASKIGLKVELPADEIAEGFTKVMDYMGSLSAFGRLKEHEEGAPNA